MPTDFVETTGATATVASPGTGGAGSAGSAGSAVDAGLDRLQTGSERRRRDPGRYLLPLAAVVAVVLAWQLVVELVPRRADVLPGPADVAGALGTLWTDGTVQQAVLTSLQRGAIGFAIAVIIGTPLGLLLGQSAPARRAFGPLVSGLQVLPSVAWVPAAIIWFGLSDATVYFVVIMGATPSIINGLIAGVDQMPPAYRAVSTVLGAGRWDTAVRVVLPAALPGYLAGLKQGWAFSWRSLMAAEIIAVGGSLGFGLGSLLQRGRDLADLGTVLVAIVVILVVGVVVELLVFGPLERRVLRRRGLLTGSAR